MNADAEYYQETDGSFLCIVTIDGMTLKSIGMTKDENEAKRICENYNKRKEKKK